MRVGRAVCLGVLSGSKSCEGPLSSPGPAVPHLHSPHATFPYFAPQTPILPPPKKKKPNRYPDREKQALFFSHYFSRRPGRPAALSPARLDALCAEADAYALASHLYWAVWAVVQARYSPIDFDYMAYHALRWGEFERRKEEFLGRAERVFGGGKA